MNGRERFRAIMNYEKFDRLPVWFFATWKETLARWRAEGLTPDKPVEAQTGMDPDWETGMWGAHGFTRLGTITPWKHEIIEETEDYRIERTELGQLIKQSKGLSSIPQHLQEALLPTRESWSAFKPMLDPADPRRLKPAWQEKARNFENREYATTTLVASLFGWPREWMGIEEWSCLPYTDPALYEEIIETICEHFIALYTPVLKEFKPEFGYIFEDCCFKNGPMISPDLYKRFYHKYYRRLVDFYHANGVDKVMLDSDGKVDILIPYWLESGIDIIFPIEVGTWKADPVELRQRFGKSLRMIGGVDKHIIPKGEKVIRESLTRLKPLVDEGGYIPIPDHRIPPDCSLEAFRSYIRIFKEIFN